MTKPDPDFVQRTIEFFILTILTAEPMHSFGIEQQFEKKTRGMFHRPSFPTTLHRVETAGWLASEWKNIEDLGRVKIYSLTATGKAHLEYEWQERRAAVAQYFGGAGLIGNFTRADTANWN